MLARSLDEYLHRALAEEEHSSGGGTAVTQATGSHGAQLYEPGAFGRSGLPTLEAYLTRKVGSAACSSWGLVGRVHRLAAAAPGQSALHPAACSCVALLPAHLPACLPPLQAGMFPDVAERLANAHLSKGDTMSALITGARPASQPARLPCPLPFCCARRQGRAAPPGPAPAPLHNAGLLSVCEALALPPPPAGEWYMRNSHFPGWGRPFEFNSQLLARVGRQEEARDVVSARRIPPASRQLRRLCCCPVVVVATAGGEEQLLRMPGCQPAALLPPRAGPPVAAPALVVVCRRLCGVARRRGDERRHGRRAAGAGGPG